MGARTASASIRCTRTPCSTPASGPTRCSPSRAKAYNLTVEQYKKNNLLEGRGVLARTWPSWPPRCAGRCSPRPPPRRCRSTAATSASFDGSRSQPIRWKGDRLELLDQRLLPDKTVYVTCRTAERGRRRRSGHGGARRAGDRMRGGFRRGARQGLEERLEVLAKSRPTAVNLFWALERMKKAHRPRSRGRGDLRRGHRRQPRHGRARRRADPERRARHDPLQRRRAGDRRLRHGARRDPLGEGQEDLGDRQRDAALSAGRAAHRVGDGAGRHPGHADHRQHGRPPDEPRRGRRGRSSAPTASPPTATWRTRSAPMRSPCWRSATASRSTSPRRSRPSTRRSPTARTSRSRSARRTRSPAIAARAGRPKASRCATPPSTSRRPSSSPASSARRASRCRPTGTRSGKLLS